MIQKATQWYNACAKNARKRDIVTKYFVRYVDTTKELDIGSSHLKRIY